MSANEVVYEEVDPTAKHVFSVWWLLVWRTLAIVIGITVVIGIIFGVLVEMAGGDSRKAGEFAGQVMGTVGWMPIFWFVTKMSLSKRYKNSRFHIVVVQRQPEPKPRIVTYYKEAPAE
jgi:hypothetical protein